MVTKVKELTMDQLRALVDKMVREKLQELLADPDEGLDVKPEIVKKLDAQRKFRKKRIPMKVIAAKYGLESR